VIGTVQKKGYRFVAPVEELAQGEFAIFKSPFTEARVEPISVY
jgi:DNA-binding winged helix-turn-helix (wHTH) protein